MPESHTQRLLKLGKSVLGAYAVLPGVACAALTGSVAEGCADEYSDLDMTVYYRALPAEEVIRRIRSEIGGGTFTWQAGTHADREFGEGFRVQGVDCQIGHIIIERWEADIERVLRAEEVATPLHKAMSGTLVSIPICGHELVEEWKKRIAGYSDPLARAMVEQHLKFFLVWGLIERLSRRDAALWMRQEIVQSSYNILAILSGLNRKYFTTFQFKRTRAFCASSLTSPFNWSGGTCPTSIAPRPTERWRVPTRRGRHSMRPRTQTRSRNWHGRPGASELGSGRAIR
ncbi:MAG: hypothetical protein ACREJC_06395 [Tepidisphaeraceae bacterium]